MPTRLAHPRGVGCVAALEKCGLEWNSPLLVETKASGELWPEVPTYGEVVQVPQLTHALWIALAPVVAR